MKRAIVPLFYRTSAARSTRSHTDDVKFRVIRKRRSTGTKINVSTLNNGLPQNPRGTSHESAKSESRWPARWWRPAEPEPATRAADAEARSGRPARRQPAEPLVFKSFFRNLAPLRRGIFLTRRAALTSSAPRKESPANVSGIRAASQISVA
jgi:hypothetical protein